MLKLKNAFKVPRRFLNPYVQRNKDTLPGPNKPVTEDTQTSPPSQPTTNITIQNETKWKLFRKFSSLSENNKVKIYAVTGVCGSILVILLILLILFATGKYKNRQLYTIMYDLLGPFIYIKVPCALTICHSRASKCVNYPFFSHCLCDYGFNGDGKKYCDGIN